MVGKIVKVTDDFVVLEVSDGVKLPVQKSAVTAACQRHSERIKSLSLYAQLPPRLSCRKLCRRIKTFNTGGSVELSKTKDRPFVYIDTHAGAGLYALNSAMAEKNAEYLNGIGKLWDNTWPELKIIWPQ